MRIKMTGQNFVGKVFGKLTVIEEAEPIIYKNNDVKIRVKCRCECGNEKVVVLRSLQNSSTTSCGCYAKEVQRKLRTKHGFIDHKLYKVWQEMKKRCSIKTNSNYHNYGGRGITVCKEWLDPETFIKWALKNGWKQGLHIDRTDNNGSYTPQNCRFVTAKVNLSNVRSNVKYKGEIAADACRRLGGGISLINSRLSYGWSLEGAFTTPIGKNYKKRKNVNF